MLDYLRFSLDQAVLDHKWKKWDSVAESSTRLILSPLIVQENRARTFIRWSGCVSKHSWMYMVSELIKLVTLGSYIFIPAVIPIIFTKTFWNTFYGIASRTHDMYFRITSMNLIFVMVNNYPREYVQTKQVCCGAEREMVRFGGLHFKSKVMKF